MNIILVSEGAVRDTTGGKYPASKGNIISHTHKRLMCRRQVIYRMLQKLRNNIFKKRNEQNLLKAIEYRGIIKLFKLQVFGGMPGCLHVVTFAAFFCYIQRSNHLQNLKSKWRGVDAIKCSQSQATAEQRFLAQLG